MLLCASLIAQWLSSHARGDRPDSPDAVRAFWNAGRYEELAQLAERREGQYYLLHEGWLAGEALLILNRPAEALKIAASLEESAPRGMTGAYLRFRSAMVRGDTAAARTIAEERVRRPDVAYGFGRGSLDSVLLGRMKLAAGEDAKTVLDNFFEKAAAQDPNCEVAFEAMAELALERGDAELASKKAAEGVRRFPANARLLVQLGEALQWTSPKEALRHWNHALELNPREEAALAALAEDRFRHEDKPGFEKLLSKLPEWSVSRSALILAQAVLGADKSRAATLLKQHSKNTLALARAGGLLSERYRFEQAVALHKAALDGDPLLTQARRDLAGDLLRLGRAAEAWPILEAVHKDDGYDVTAFNLLELKERVSGFTQVETPHFTIHMDPLEASVYGDRVGRLLERAYETLTARYGFKPSDRTHVEIFPDQKDFAVRTFGVPGGDGYLGVCFGPVITAPSPASPRAAGHSWEATLWHEFTHTITLTLTHNRIPRWLSEGISVFEEQQANPGWGRRFLPRHAPRLLAGECTPVDEMSSAFRSGDGAALDFAYFQAGLIVEWMVQKAGMHTLKALLSDLASGVELNAAIVKRYGPMPGVNSAFFKYAADWARKSAGSLEWRTGAPRKEEAPGSPQTYEELLDSARKSLAAGDLKSARETLESALRQPPSVPDPEGVYPSLAKVYRRLGLEKEEAAALERGLELTADLPGAHERLAQIYAGWRDWGALERTSRNSLGVSPMSLPVVESLLKAQEGAGNREAAAETCRKALALDPGRAPRWHSLLGRLLEMSDPAEARVHLLEALEINPRDRDALQALARISSSKPPQKTQPPDKP
jgi:tetratricopeptide (TPR) repeat protein